MQFVLVLANAFIILYEEFPGAGHGEDGLPVCQVFGDLEGISDAAGNRSVFCAWSAPGDVLLYEYARGGMMTKGGGKSRDDWKVPALFTGSFNEDETKPENLCGGQGEIQVVFFGQFTDDDAVAFHTGMHFLRETAGGCRVSTGLTDITGFR